MIPESLRTFALDALDRALKDPRLLDSLLGEYLTAPKPQVWFEAQTREVRSVAGVRLDRRTRMMFDAHHVFINGEGFKVAGRDTRLLRQLANTRSLPHAQVLQLSEDARDALCEWIQSGWLKTL